LALAGITIEEVSVEQLVSMADGLTAASQPTLAAQLYAVALKRAPASMRPKIRVRLGLARTPSRRTASTLEVLRELERLNAVGQPFVGDGLATWLKIQPFADDGRFLDLVDAHADLLPIANWHWNLLAPLWAVQICRDVPGDFVELGVFKGHTTLFCADYVAFQEWPKTWWLYDTFEGIPEDQRAPGWDRLNARAYEGAFSFEEVAERFIPFPNIRLVRGRVPEVLAEQSPKQIAFLHMDLNNAPAEIAALDALFDRVSVGGVVLFDDYCWANARAQHDAEKAWFEARGLSILPMATGQGLFVKQRA
jgi:hypothetical protein